MRYRQFACTAMYAAILLTGLTKATDARAAFSCGPHAATYRVTSNQGLVGDGVRCVVINQQDLSWYGEGVWRIPEFKTLSYRHYGTADLRRMPGKGQAADLYGNGENATWRALNLSFTLTGNPSRPATIQVTGDWKETWTLTSNGTHPGYTSRLAPLDHCGAHYTEYRLWDNDGQGSGVRCLLMDQGGVFRGVGGGNHGGTRYLHVFQQNPAPGSGLFADICDRSQADFCNQGKIALRREDSTIVVDGSTERWLFEHGVVSFTPNPRVVEFAYRKMGAQVGNGECWTLAFEALGFAKAWQPGRDGRDVFNFGQNVTGQSLVAGDIIQLFDARIDYPDGSWSTFIPQHTAIIEWAVGKRLGVLHQNVGGDRRVQRGVIDLDYLTRGNYQIYRPLAR